jgi:hypothetical protein
VNDVIFTVVYKYFIYCVLFMHSLLIFGITSVLYTLGPSPETIFIQSYCSHCLINKLAVRFDAKY